jgi:hypothetical protein
MIGKLEGDNVRYFVIGVLLATALFVLTGAAVSNRIGKYQVAVTISSGAPAVQQVVVAVIDTETGVVNLNRHEFSKVSPSR